MSYYSDNDWRYYSEDYLEHKSLRDRWNDLMDKTTIDDKIKGAYEGAKGAVRNGVNRVRDLKNIDNAIGTAASNVKAAVSGATGKVRNMFGRKFEWPNGNNSSLYNSMYYQAFRKRILAAQKAYRDAKRKAEGEVRRRVSESKNQVDDRILGAVDKAVSNARYGLTTARRNAKTAIDLAGRNSKRALDNARSAADTAANRLERSARGVVPGMAMTEYRDDQRRREEARNEYEATQRRQAGGSQRRRSNRG